VADEELLAGAVVDVAADEDAVPELPVVPVAESAESDLLPFEELWVFVAAVDFDEEEVESVEERTVLAPGRSWATTTPMAIVAPAAATIAPRVSVRSRDWALSRSAGVLGWGDSDMG
jgi:hypothetical protein